MRTTITIDDELLDRARREAADRRLPLGTVINRALRRGLHEPRSVEAITRTITFGDPDQPPPGTARFAVLEDEELDWLRRKCGV
ncbi:MAG: antitoxin [Myxococcales bacterium]|nr:antitoxin [Myxococcales bacterium]